MTQRLIVFCTTLLLAGCLLGPDYERPDVPVPDGFGQTIDAGESIANLPWWELFEDEKLETLIQVALEENKDAAIAAARVEEARARLGFVRADQFPQVDVTGQAARSDPGAVFPSFGIQEQYRLAADLTFELDIWGRLRRSTEAARAELLSTEAARQTVIITLIADVASAYLLLRDADERYLIAERTLESRQDSLAIIQARFDKGTVPMLDVNQAQVEEALAAAALAAVEREVIQTENLLGTLLGRNPGPILRERGAKSSLTLPAVPAGLPSELLARRPDVRQAEQALAAQTARIGAAQALRLPTVNLTGALGFASDDLSNLVDSDGVAWNVGGNLLGPLFDAGKSKRQVEIEQARTEQLLKEYEQTVLESFAEVEDALAGVRTFGAELAARRRQLVAARSAATLSRAR
ncbi:MAG: efflux transporter outer membrane subunit, partial [Gammaproteobacteria bacterium]|nr:efflux transporter outer membrane subunit [Gammaproteobacteria bacterium]